MENNNVKMVGDYFAYGVMSDILEIFKKVNELKYENPGQFHMILGQIF